MKQQFPILFGAVAGILIMLSSFFTAPALQTVSQELLQWRVIVGAFALLLGIANITRIYYHRIIRKDKNTLFAALLLVVMYGSVGLGLAYGVQSTQYKFVFDNIYAPLNATWYSTTAFYMISSAWRGFRIRSGQAAILMASAIFVMLSKVGIGELIWNQIPVIGNWISAIPNTAGVRGIGIGACLGAVGVSLRIMLGLERGHLGGGVDS